MEIGILDVNTCNFITIYEGEGIRIKLTSGAIFELKDLVDSISINSRGQMEVQPKYSNMVVIKGKKLGEEK